MYPSEFKDHITQIEATREQRLAETFKRITEEEKQALLKENHPDFVIAGMRELLTGPNKGQRTPNELAELLEGNSRVDPSTIDLESVDYDVDVLVIGGGGAGTATALVAHENGAKVLLATKLRLGDANTMMAQGGIQAADKENDSPAIHYVDVIGGGHFHNTPELVEGLVKDAPSIIQWLESLGCMFDKQPDGTMRTEHGGGTSRKRMHAARDYTGAEIMRTLRDEVRNKDITVLEFSPALELIMDDKGQVAGAILMNIETNEISVVRAKATVLATGGGGRLHYQEFPTTNHYGATADGLVMAYRVGADLLFIDTMQYHPTGVAFPEQIVGQLITEKVRGLGAKLANRDGAQFIYPLETRDVVAASIIRECNRGLGLTTPAGMPCVWLDSPLIEMIHGPGTIQRDLPAMYMQFKRFDIDMSKEPILTYPTLHYQNGGIKINAQGATSVPNLYVAGEASGGVHGRNRLMGNSLLDILVFGRRVGKETTQKVKETQIGKMTLAHVNEWQEQQRKAGLEGTRPVSPKILPEYTRHGKLATSDIEPAVSL